MGTEVKEKIKIEKGQIWIRQDHAEDLFMGLNAILSRNKNHYTYEPAPYAIKIQDRATFKGKKIKSFFTREYADKNAFTNNESTLSLVSETNNNLESLFKLDVPMTLTNLRQIAKNK